MFSGLTNQVSSWMGGTAKKDDPQKSDEEKLSSPTTENEVTNNMESDAKKDTRYANFLLSWTVVTNL